MTALDPDRLLEAACRGRWHLFDEPERLPAKVRALRTAAAKTICAGCPIRLACLDEALRLRDWNGVRGGLTPHERRKMRRPSTEGAQAA